MSNRRQPGDELEAKGVFDKARSTFDGETPTSKWAAVFGAREIKRTKRDEAGRVPGRVPAAPRRRTPEKMSPPVNTKLLVVGGLAVLGLLLLVAATAVWVLVLGALILGVALGVGLIASMQASEHAKANARNLSRAKSKHAGARARASMGASSESEPQEGESHESESHEGESHETKAAEPAPLEKQAGDEEAGRNDG